MEIPTQLSMIYTLTCLARLDLWLRREVIRFRLQMKPQTDPEFLGLYISDEEVDALLDEQHPAYSVMDPLPLPEEAAGALDRAAQAVEEQMAGLVEDARRSGLTLRLEQLAALFGLSELERQVILICLAPELDLKYERLYAYLQDDVTKKRPTLDLVMRLLCPTLEARVTARRAFEPSAALLAWNLISLHDDPGARRPALLARYLKLDERVTGYLLGSDAPDDRLAQLTEPGAGEPDLALADGPRRQLAEWARAWPAAWAAAAPVILFHGRYGSGRYAAAGYLAAQLGVPCLSLSAANLLHSELRPEYAVRLAEREALLTGALVCWNHAEALLELDLTGDPARERHAFIQALARGRAPVILISAKTWEPTRELPGRPFLRLEFPDPGFAERRAAWAASLNGQVADEPGGLPGIEPDALAGRYRLTVGQIWDAVERARTLVWAREPSRTRLDEKDLEAASRGQSQHRLTALARKLDPRYTWDDIVLPRNHLATLRLICATVRQRPTVYGEWGFGRKLSLGKGLIALFAGPSGTGKTMSAEIVANELGLDLFKINLSSVVSKYIGETEKNLERIFSEAQDTDAILFFDEADALFGKRSEVKDAHDRYANIETAYLLQRTEEYDGLVILASNIKKNMDEAFVRRLHFVLEFPFPEEAERLEIWKRTFPASMPRGDDLDLPFLARKLKIAGGNIRNIILTAAFLAAEEHAPVAMRHLVRGASYEFQKLGKLVVEGDFEQYYELVRA